MSKVEELARTLAIFPRASLSDVHGIAEVAYSPQDSVTVTDADGLRVVRLTTGQPTSRLSVSVTYGRAIPGYVSAGVPSTVIYA